MKLLKIKEYNGRIVLRSGLHIGSGNMEMHIGGTDSPVIRHPHTLEPYIPGSSLKGKTRSMLELQSGFIAITGGSVINQEHLLKAIDDEMRTSGENILKLFGSSGAEQDKEGKIGPTRVSFADCYLNKEWLGKAKRNRWPLTEEKSENCIDRIRGVAQHPPLHRACARRHRV
jgi:CRISPR-associated protein Csm3